ncbi:MULTISPECIES: cytochrome P450 [Streptomyces]|uniref:Cytochrome P450 n=1 Tax=Streptomyces thermoviolaceus subsp. thermoviolaceus TaxID=66860 RepID=A0ABX0YU07_STRTL|nr:MULTISPECIES: cytochrome P450 [Streptomyces]MCM3266683.1 cytochrome P450 [Streptomyces thermoviolaceus]NJP16061.1 cytochrome P450 [Streptomyces thermoviolaceus subsp. thermoviolaceus]RSS01170.1 cytochrome P450 [Streptomyces sp. WAC00469]WTD48248.1 cytochrome P450 [Streptomyces thermoviolaceus]GGV70527.1 cytochrome P450 [Streptomyces thermoviolaceus subsp. apingens]
MAAVRDLPFDPWDPAFLADPYPAYAELRARGRVLYYEPSNQWLVPHHADVAALLRDRRLGRTYTHRFTHEEFGRTPPPPEHEPFHTLNDHGMLDLEPPDHTRIRRLVSKAFTPRTVERLRPYVHRLAGELVDGLVRDGGGDLLTDVAEPLPVAVIAEMLGIPEADRAQLRPWSAAICGMYELNPTPRAAEAAVRASVEFSGYLRALIAERRRAPGDDLISGLIAAHDEGDRLTEQEMISTAVLLLDAGHEATVNATVNGWWALFRNPAQLAALRADHGLVPSAVEELLRYDTPLQLFERWVLDEIEIDGTTIPRGAELALLFGSANHDPAVFAEPERLDLARRDNPHISFSAGIHYCIGAPLARMELAASLTALLRKAPTLRLAAEPERTPNFVIRGLKGLSVEVG